MIADTKRPQSSFENNYLWIVSKGSTVTADTSFTWGQWRKSKLAKEVMDDRDETSLSCRHERIFKLVKVMMDERGDTSLS